jgi:hypothetical protein
MSTGPGPHGQAVGLFKVARKTALPGGHIAVWFEAVDGLGFMSRIMSPEDADYYVDDAIYLLNATTP